MPSAMALIPISSPDAGQQEYEPLRAAHQMLGPQRGCHDVSQAPGLLGSPWTSDHPRGQPPLGHRRVSQRWPSPRAAGPAAVPPWFGCCGTHPRHHSFVAHQRLGLPLRRPGSCVTCHGNGGGDPRIISPRLLNAACTACAHARAATLHCVLGCCRSTSRAQGTHGAHGPRTHGTTLQKSIVLLQPLPQVCMRPQPLTSFGTPLVGVSAIRTRGGVRPCNAGSLPLRCDGAAEASVP